MVDKSGEKNEFPNIFENGVVNSNWIQANVYGQHGATLIPYSHLHRRCTAEKPCDVIIPPVCERARRAACWSGFLLCRLREKPVRGYGRGLERHSQGIFFKKMPLIPPGLHLVLSYIGVGLV